MLSSISTVGVFVRSELFDEKYTAQPPTQVGITLQSSHCVKATINGEILARQGALIAYRGNLGIEVKSQGMGNFLKRAMTGEGLKLMSVRGQGEAWFANVAEHCFVLDFESGDGFSVNGRNVLCFDSTLQYQIGMVSGAGMFGGGLFNSTFTGQGRLAISADGHPLVIPVSPNMPVLVDTDAVVGWSAQLQTQIHRSQGMKSILRGGSGEMFQIVFQGQGFVLVQPSEGMPVTKSSSGGALSGLLNG
jgi:uncharacterized protein (AIM24 family)